MKIRVIENPEISEIEVHILCQTKNEQTDAIFNTLTYLNKNIIGKLNGKNYTLSLKQIYYFDSIDNKVFAYVKDNVFEVNLKLYQLEEFLETTPFLRINKNTILNIKKIKSFHSQVNGRMEAILLNQEIVIVSRKYVPILKQMLGGDK